MKCNISKHIFLKPNSWVQDLGQQGELEAFAESREEERENSESAAAKTNSPKQKDVEGTGHPGGWSPAGVGRG